MKKIKYFFRNRKSSRRKKLLGPYAKGIIYESENGIISMPVEDFSIGKELGFKGKWDTDEINMLLKNVRQDDTIYFIGTHVGTLLIPVSKKVDRIIGYEANEQTYWYLNINLHLNDVRNATVFNNAVGDKKKSVTFYQNTVNTGGSKIKPIKDSIIYNYDNPSETMVDMITLDAHRTQENLPQPQGIIMDIEGSEYFALKGMQQTLQAVRFLYVEYVPHHLENVSNVSITEFVDLIVPYFKSAAFLDKNITIGLTDGANALLVHLKELQSKNRASNILFLK